MNSTPGDQAEQQGSSRRILRKFLLCCGLAVIAYIVFYSWGDLLKLGASMHWGYFALGTVLAIGNNAIASELQRALYHKHGVCFDRRTGFTLYFYSQLSKYIPGKIWMIVYQAMMLGSRSTPLIAFLVNVELMLTLILITVFCATTLLAWQISAVASTALLIAGIGISSLGIKIHIFPRLVGLLRRSSKITQGNTLTKQPSLKILRLVSLFFLSWLVVNYVMLHLAFQLSLNHALYIAAWLGLAWAISVFAFLVPGGIGIKEAVFVYIAQYFEIDQSMTMLASIAVMTRLATIVQELSGAGLAFLFTRKKPGTQPTSATDAG